MLLLPRTVKGELTFHRSWPMHRFMASVVLELCMNDAHEQSSLQPLRLLAGAGVKQNPMIAGNF